MRAQIHPQENFISIDDVPLTLAAELMPAGPILDRDANGNAIPFALDPARAIEVIHFDGAIGMIQRRSRAPGRHDIEHFLGPDAIQPYIDVYFSEQKRRADEKAKRDQEEERKAQHAADLAAKAAAG
jgi:hypothetical protein